MGLTAFFRAALLCGGLLIAATTARAHPVAKDSHDRVVNVHLQKTDAPHRLIVRVAYRLEVAEETVILRDMREHREEVPPADYFPDRPLEFYARFAKIYEGELAGRLRGSANQKPLPAFVCVERKPALVDEAGMQLGHLRCDFVFTSAFDIDPAAKLDFAFEDKTYYLEDGKLTLHFINESGLAVEKISQPDAASAEKPAGALDDDRLRRITAVLAPGVAVPAKIAEPAKAPAPPAHEHERFALLPLLLHSEYGVAITLLLAFVFGAIHALTPGHGKTLVAAYLVGERGTIWHALYLGLITTATHTGALVLLGGIIALLPEEHQERFVGWLTGGLGLLMGLLVVGMGFWLLLQRLAGRADHVHLGSGHHHHHHHGDAPAEPAPPRSLSWWGLTLLGITGGVIPCVDGVGVLFYAIASHQFWFVLPAILAFSAGLAAVLVVIGIVIVQVPRFAQSRLGNGRVVQSLPIVSAVAVTVLGFWLCFEAVRR